MFTIAKELNSIQGTMSSIFVAKAEDKRKGGLENRRKHKKCLASITPLAGRMGKVVQRTG
jgi:hypothetical protein